MNIEITLLDSITSQIDNAMESLGLIYRETKNEAIQAAIGKELFLMEKRLESLLDIQTEFSENTD